IGSFRQGCSGHFTKHFLLCVVAAYLVPYALLSPLGRYGLPIVPIVLLFASSGLISLLKSYGLLVRDRVHDLPLVAESGPPAGAPTSHALSHGSSWFLWSSKPA